MRFFESKGAECGVAKLSAVYSAVYSKPLFHYYFLSSNNVDALAGSGEALAGEGVDGSGVVILR